MVPKIMRTYLLNINYINELKHLLRAQTKTGPLQPQAFHSAAIW